jgi:hypothetical protein
MAFKVVRRDLGSQAMEYPRAWTTELAIGVGLASGNLQRSWPKLMSARLMVRHPPFCLCCCRLRIPLFGFKFASLIHEVDVADHGAVAGSKLHRDWRWIDDGNTLAIDRPIYG